MQSAIDQSTLLQMALELSPTPALIADAAGQVVLVNREFERRFGYAREELVGQPVDLVVPNGGHPRGSDAARPDRGEAFVRRKDGSKVAVDIRRQRVQARDQAFVLTSIHETSAPRRADDSVDDSATELLAGLRAARRQGAARARRPRRG